MPNFRAQHATISDWLKKAKDNPALSVAVVPILGEGEQYPLISIDLSTEGGLKLCYGAAGRRRAGFELTISANEGDRISIGNSVARFSSDGESGMMVFGTRAFIASRLPHDFEH